MGASLQGNMADLFVSYSRKDPALVRRMCEALKERGREAWVDWECTAPGFLDTRGGTSIAPPSSISDPDATVRSRFMSHAAASAIRAPAGVRWPRRSRSHSLL